jgi:hypothetical protein
MSKTDVREESAVLVEGIERLAHGQELVVTNSTWTMVRVRRRTHSRLVKLRDGLLAAYQEGRIELQGSECESISFDFLINNLIDRVLSHRERARKQKRARAGKTGQIPSEPSIGNPTRAVYTRPAPDGSRPAS